MLGQTKFEGLTFCLDVNQESVDNLLITRALKNFTVENAYTGFTYVTLRDITSVIRNQWECRIQNFKIFSLLRDS